MGRTTIAADARRLVEAATVRLPERGGQAVLVRGGFLLTATHCIDWDGSGSMALGAVHRVAVTTPDGATFALGPVAADPIADLAVLGALDNQEFSADCEAFEAWQERTPGLALSGAFETWCASAPIGAEQVFDVHCLTHMGEWISGQARRLVFEAAGPSAWVQLAAPIHGGTSGGPIVDNAGALVGVMSQTLEVVDGPCDGSQPIAAYALPQWVLTRISRGEV